jgi:ATP-dependent DNA helicase RecG
LTALKAKPLSRSQIAQTLGHSSVSGALNRSISRLMDQDLIAYTLPDKPQSRLQKYRLTGNTPKRA